MQLIKKSRLCFIILASILSISAFIIINLPFTKAADIPIEGYVEGGLTIILNGDWETGIVFEPVKQISGYEENQTSYWSAVALEDYISFADDTGTTGFYLTLDQTNFTYTGTDPTQTALNASNYKIIGNYENGSALAVTKGYDDPSYNLSILPDSCTSATTDSFTFHSDFYDSQENYSLTGSLIERTILESTASCLALGHIRFDRNEFFPKTPRQSKQLPRNFIHNGQK